MTHEYVLLVGGTVIAGGGAPDAAAIAWAEDTVIGLGDDAEVRGMSRGDSQVVDLDGAVVIPLGPGYEARWPTDAILEIGGPADLAILDADPRRFASPDGGSLSARALICGGQVVSGSLPGGVRLAGHDH